MCAQLFVATGKAIVASAIAFSLKFQTFASLTLTFGEAAAVHMAWICQNFFFKFEILLLQTLSAAQWFRTCCLPQRNASIGDIGFDQMAARAWFEFVAAVKLFKCPIFGPNSIESLVCDLFDNANDIAVVDFWAINIRYRNAYALTNFGGRKS